MPPPITATLGPELAVEFADNLHHSFDVFNRGFGQNAVSKIHDVPGTRTSPLQKVRNFNPQLGQWCKQRYWIQIALNRTSVPCFHPGLIYVYPPVDPEHIASGGMQFFEKASGTCAEVNHRNSPAPRPLDKRP